MKDVSKRIAQLRRERNMTQDELAEQLHVTRQAVSSWETKKTRPDVETLEKICEVFHMDLMTFLYGEEAPGIDQTKLRPVMLFGAMAVLGIFLRLFAAPVIAALAERTYNMGAVLALGGLLRVLQGAWVPLVASLLSLRTEVAVKSTSVRKLLLGLGAVPVVLAAVMAVMAVVMRGQSSTGVPEGWFAVYMGIYAVVMNRYTPLITGGLLYFGIKKPYKKR